MQGYGVISLNRNRGCIDHTSGLWSCDIPDSSGKMQSLYIYISNTKSHGMLNYFLCMLSLMYYHRTTKQVSIYELHSTH